MEYGTVLYNFISAPSKWTDVLINVIVDIVTLLQADKFIVDDLLCSDRKILSATRSLCSISFALYIYYY